MSNTKQESTLRLLFPQWQGGNNPPYFLGAHLLNWLAPVSNDLFEEVPVAKPSSNFQTKDHIYGKEILLEQAKSAKDILEKHNPDRIVVLGGDCSVDLVPFSFLNQKYDDDVAVIWADAHPDVDQPEQFENHHAHVVSNLIGVGDKDFLEFVPKKYRPENILYVGINTVSDTQGEFMKKHGLKSLSADNQELILKWLQETKKSKVAIHFDLDVLDLREFRSLLIANPKTYEKMNKEVPLGTSMNTMTQLLQSIAKEHDVVGLGITEHFPWDAYFLKDMLSKLPLIGDINKKENTAPYNWIF